jgi:signal transduction histidine kinase/CheY-like chemotaxis protein
MPILLIEDNPITRKLVRFALEGAGYQVIDAVDGREGLEKFTAESVTLVLLDLNLPDADGFEVLTRLRATPRGKDIPILAFSGMLSAHDGARLTTVGFDDVVTKPIEPSRLIQIVRAHAPHATTPPVKGLRRRIVLADDDAVQRKLCTLRLQRAGFTVTAAADGEEALAMIRSHRPDAVVSDVLMPRLDGFGLCMAIRRDPEIANTPILLISNSYLETDDVALARRAGADDLMVRTPELTDVIARLSAEKIVERPNGLPPSPPANERELEQARVTRMMSQLERQVAVQAGLSQRCALLAAELSVLSGISEALARQDDIEAALYDVLASCFDAGGISVGMLYLRAPEGLRGVAFGQQDGWSPIDIDTFFGQRALLDQVIETQKLVSLPAETGPIIEGRALLARTASNSILITPLGYRGAPQGALVTLSRTMDLQTADRIAFSQAVAGQISVALALARSFKTAQQQLLVADRMAALGMLAAGVGHEINNPLMAVLGNLELAQHDVGALKERHREVDLGELPETLRDAYDAAGRMRGIVRDLKLFSRGDDDSRGAVDVVPVIESSLRIVSHELKYRANLVRDLQPVPQVWANEARLGQVFLNMIVNAVHALPEERSKTNELRVATSIDPDGRVRVEIADNGVGMAPDVVAHIFTPFFTTKPIGVGTGLGLAICHQLVTSIGGEIIVATEVGKGTTFKVLLPASPPEIRA